MKGWPLDMQPQRQDAHRAIVSSGLVCSSLCSFTMARAQIDSVRWLAGDRYTVFAVHLQIRPTLV